MQHKKFWKSDFQFCVALLKKMTGFKRIKQDQKSTKRLENSICFNCFVGFHSGSLTTNLMSSKHSFTATTVASGIHLPELVGAILRRILCFSVKSLDDWNEFGIISRRLELIRTPGFMKVFALIVTLLRDSR